MVRLYSNGCPRCQVLKQKLGNKNIPYEICDDTEKMLELGIEDVPMLEIKDGIIINFTEAVNWVNDQGTVIE